MSDPYRTPAPSTEESRPNACSQPTPACDPAAHDDMLGQLLREQIALQRKLLWVGRLAIVASIVPWAILGITLSSSLSRPESPARRTKAVVHASQPSQPRPKRAPRARRPSAMRIANALSGGGTGLSTAHVRATAHANKAVLDAYARHDTHVHVLQLSRSEARRLFRATDLRTRIMPIELPGGSSGFKVVRLPDSGWLEQVGIRRGDVIVRVNGQSITDPQKALALYDEVSKAQHFVVEIVRDDQVHVFSVSWSG